MKLNNYVLNYFIRRVHNMKKFFAYVVSIFQTILGINVIGIMTSSMENKIAPIIFLAVLLAALALAMGRLRECVQFFPYLMEFLLAPIAFVRILLGTIVSTRFQRSSLELTFDDENVIAAIFGYLFYIELGSEFRIGRVANLILMAFFVLPLSFLMAYGLMGMMGSVPAFLAGLNIPLLNPALSFFILFISAAFLVSIRGCAVTVETYNPNYKFEHRSGAKFSAYSTDALSLTNDAIEAGWGKVSGGFETHISIYLILTLLLSPILCITLTIGTIVAILSLFIQPIYSNVGQLDFYEVPLGFLQKILHFFFAFVIYP